MDTVNQMKEHAISVVIFDIDSISGVSKKFHQCKKRFLSQLLLPLKTMLFHIRKSDQMPWMNKTLS
jgi:hypothetical protein